MTCPLPGMDPYIEAMGLWEGLQAPLVTHCSDILHQRLPEGYVSRIETRVRMLTIDLSRELCVPDVLIGREPDASGFFSSPAGQSSGVATNEPITMPLAIGEVEIRERWIEIESLPELELVTVIEVLSPTNKSGEGRNEYLQKRAAVIDRTVNLVEIDLLLGGRPTPLENRCRRIITTRSWRGCSRPDAQVDTWTIRHRLPWIPIPLRSPDPDVKLDLGEAFDMPYRLGRLVRYQGPLPEDVRLSPADRQWAEAAGR